MSKIQIVNLTKIYRSRNKEVVALNGVNLDLNEGEICVLLGPNGAGKTTLVKIICGILLPDEGEVFIDGKSVIKNTKIAKEKVGVIFEEARNTYHYLTVEGNLKYFGYLNHIPERILAQRISKDLKWLDLTEKTLCIRLFPLPGDATKVVRRSGDDKGLSCIASRRPHFGAGHHRCRRNQGLSADAYQRQREDNFAHYA